MAGHQGAAQTCSGHVCTHARTRTHSHGVMSQTEFHFCSEQLQLQVRPAVVPPQNFPDRGSVTSQCPIPVRCRSEGFSRTSFRTVPLKPAPAPVLTPRPTRRCHLRKRGRKLKPLGHQKRSALSAPSELSHFSLKFGRIETERELSTLSFFQNYGAFHFYLGA